MSREATRHFNDAVRRDPKAAFDQWRRLQDAFDTRGITFNGRPMPTFLRPQFVDAATFTALTRGANVLVPLAERVARHAFGGDLEALLEFLQAPESHRRMLRLLPKGPDVALSRVDGFLDAQGGVRFIEINSDAPAGFGYAERMTQVFSELPLVRAMRRSDHMEVVGSVDALLDELRRQAGLERPRVAIVDLRTVKTRPDQEILRDEFVARGVDTLLCDPRDMTIIGDRLVAHDAPVDVVYRRTVIAEVLEIEAEAPAFFEAYSRRLAVFVNSFRCYLSEDKAFFALLTDERYAGLFSPEERAFIDAHIPWTRRMEARKTSLRGEVVDLVPHIEARREAFVLKPSHGYGGASVLVGAAVDAATWTAAVQRAASEPGWIVQERVEIPEEEFPVFDDAGDLRFESLKVNTNPFYVGGAAVGAVTRVSRDAVINVSAGGGSVPTFVA